MRRKTMDAHHLIQTEDGQLLWYDSKTKTYRMVEAPPNAAPSPMANPEIDPQLQQQEHIQSSYEITATYDPKAPHSEIYVEDTQDELLQYETTASSVKYIWDEPQTMLLLEQCKTWKEDINNPRVKKIDIYKKIACEMRKYNYQFTWLQCQNRMKTLLTKYKEIRDHLSRTGNNSRTWAYYDVMTDYIGDRPNVKPTSSLSTLQLQKQISDSEASSSTSCTTASSSSNKITKKKIINKTSPRNKMLLWLEQHAKEIKEKEEKRLEVLERHHEENKELFKQFLQAFNADKKN